MASSTPATSANVTLTWSSFRSFALDFPKLIAPRPPPPPCIWRMKKTHSPSRMMNGNQLIRMFSRRFGRSGGVCSNSTPARSSSPISALLSLSGLNVVKRWPPVRTPTISEPSNVRRSTWPLLTEVRNSE